MQMQPWWDYCSSFCWSLQLLLPSSHYRLTPLSLAKQRHGHDYTHHTLCSPCYMVYTV